jgi:phage terminase small subunit
VPRPRTPIGKAELTGAAAHNPQRFRDRAEPEAEEIGFAPEYLDDAAKAAWASFVAEWPWLTKADEAALVPLCIMRAGLETGTAEQSAAFFKEYRMQISAFGGNPTTKTKIAMPKAPPPDDPFAKLDRKPN